MNFPHCSTCDRYPQAFRLGYVEALEGPTDDVGNTTDVPLDPDHESHWWRAYWHGKAVGRQARDDEA